MSERLNGWKEISAALGKSVRTVQRWERDYGLPVHRLGEPGGEIVYAFASELKAWERRNLPLKGGAPLSGVESPQLPASGTVRSDAQRSNRSDPAVKTTHSRSGLRGIVTAVLLLAGVVAAIWTWPAGRGGATLQPHHTSVAGDTLSVYGADGSWLWDHSFDWRLPDGLDKSSEVHGISILDVDGDGNQEVLVLAPPADFATQAEGALFWFDWRGRVRRQYAPKGTVRFGDTRFDGPWIPYNLFTTTDDTGVISVWAVFVHAPNFPSLLVKLDSHGRPNDYYWSNGYVGYVGRIRWKGRPAIVVGASNNELRGASIALLDEQRPRGSAPAFRSDYRCNSGCPTGSPIEFIVFPRACFKVVQDGTANVVLIRQEDSGTLNVAVSHGTWYPPIVPIPTSSWIWYRLSATLQTLAVDPTGEFTHVHEALRRAEWIPHAWDPSEIRELSRLVRWDGTRFVPLPSPTPSGQ